MKTLKYILLALSVFTSVSGHAETNIYSVFQAGPEMEETLSGLKRIYPKFVADFENLRIGYARLQDGQKISSADGYKLHMNYLDPSSNATRALFAQTMGSLNRLSTEFLSESEHEQWIKDFIRLTQIATFTVDQQARMVQLLMVTKWSAGPKTSEYPYETGYNLAFADEVAAHSYKNLMSDLPAAFDELAKFQSRLEALAESSSQRQLEAQSLISKAELAHPGFLGATGLDIPTLNALDEVSRPIIQTLITFGQLQNAGNRAGAMLNNLKEIRTPEDVKFIQALSEQSSKAGKQLEQQLDDLWPATTEALTKANIPDRTGVLKRLKEDTNITSTTKKLLRAAKGSIIMSEAFGEFATLADHNFKKWSAVSNTVAQSLTPPRRFKFDNVAADAAYSKILLDVKAKLTELQN